MATPSSLASKYGDSFYSYDCGGTYKWYLTQYIETAREVGAIPVLVTPVSRLYYTNDGTIKPHHDSTDTTTGTLVTENNAYVEAVKQLAKEQNVLLIDGFEITKICMRKHTKQMKRQLMANLLMVCRLCQQEIAHIAISLAVL